MDCNLPGSSVQGIHQARILSGLPFPSPGHLPDSGIKLLPPALQADSYLLSHQETAYLILRSIWKKNNKDYCCKRKKKFWRSSSISWKRWLLIKLINMKYTVEWRTNVCSVCLRCSLQLVNLSCHPLTLHSHLNFQWKLKFLKVVFQNKIFLAPYLLQYSEH